MDPLRSWSQNRQLIILLFAFVFFLSIPQTVSAQNKSNTQKNIPQQLLEPGGVIITDSNWSTSSQTSDCVKGEGDDTWILKLSVSRKVTITVQDCCCPGDFYEVRVDGKLIGKTPNLAPPWGCGFSGPLSSGSFEVLLSAGTRQIKVRDAGFDGHSQQEIQGQSMCPAHFTVSGTLGPPPQVKLQKRGKTVIEAGNNYSENTTIEATVVFPPGHPKAGKVVSDFNGIITHEEDSGRTPYYDGVNGATRLPMAVQAKNGKAKIVLKSVSNSTGISGPIDARVRATAAGLDRDTSTNPLSVDQWIDENRNGFIDWLEGHSKDILMCAKSKPGEVGTVAKKVSKISQETGGDCGTTPIQLSEKSPIRISPVCGPGNRHRLNVNNELVDTVLHEARHAWQNSQRARRVGVDDDRNSLTPQNDDDGDFFLEVVEFASANIITEAVSGSGDNSPDAGGVTQWETDAPNFAGGNKGLCP